MYIVYSHLFETNYDPPASLFSASGQRRLLSNNCTQCPERSTIEGFGPQALDLRSLRIHCPFIFRCLWAPFTFGALIRVFCNIGGVLGVSVGKPFLFSGLGCLVSRRFRCSSLEINVSRAAFLNVATEVAIYTRSLSLGSCSALSASPSFPP